ncbi:MAG: TIGR02281 family clan AA aspartic protease [Paracoccaceae bacterium]
MRAILVLAVLVLLFLLVRNSTTLDAGLTHIDPIIAGYGALFIAGIVTAELLRPLLSLLSGSSRFVVVAVLAALVWLGADRMLLQDRLPAFVPEPASHSPATAGNGRQTSLSPSWDGIYRTVAQINNQSVGALIDPATPLVLLQYQEAERIGLHPETLTFSDRIAVSDRKVSAARLTLVSVRIDTLDLLQVDAAIAAPGELETSLVGLSFLNRLDRVQFSDGTLVLAR